MQDVQFVSVRVVKVEIEERVPLSILEDVADGLDLVPTGKEHEDVTFVGLRENVRDDQGEERVRHVEVVNLSDWFPGSVVEGDDGDKFSLEVGDDRLFREDPSSSVLRDALALERFDNVVEPVLLDREGATCGYEGPRQ